MTNATTHRMAGVTCLVAETRCACGRELVLVQMPGAKLTREAAVCFVCVPVAPRTGG